MRGGNSAFSRARLMLKLESSWQRVGFSRELEMGYKLSTLPNVRFARGWSDICAKVPEGRLASDRTSGYPHGKARRASGRDADEPRLLVRRSREKDLSSKRVKRLIDLCPRARIQVYKTILDNYSYEQEKKMLISYQELIEEIFAHGGTFVRHGRSHDQYASASGEPIWVPRHRGDAPKGLERKVFKQLRLGEQGFRRVK